MLLVVVPRKALGIHEILEQDYCKVCFSQIMLPYSSKGLCYCMCIYLEVKQISSRVFIALKRCLVVVLVNLQTIYEKPEKSIKTC